MDLFQIFNYGIVVSLIFFFIVLIDFKLISLLGGKVSILKISLLNFVAISIYFIIEFFYNLFLNDPTTPIFLLFLGKMMYKVIPLLVYILGLNIYCEMDYGMLRKMVFFKFLLNGIIGLIMFAILG